MVVTDAVSGNPDPESRRDRALTRRIESLRAALSAAESEKAALRRERDVAQRRAEAAGRLLDEVRAEASARMSELETKAAAAELSRMSAERSALIEGEKFRYADYRARQLASMLEALQRPPGIFEASDESLRQLGVERPVQTAADSPVRAEGRGLRRRQCPRIRRIGRGRP
jgi:chromosome segregation ATPase